MSFSLCVLNKARTEEWPFSSQACMNSCHYSVLLNGSPQCQVKGSSLQCDTETEYFPFADLEIPADNMPLSGLIPAL